MLTLKLLILFLFFPSICFAHQGRLDGSGGHRVNKPFTYDGRYIEIIDGKTFYKDGKERFKDGSYHFHVHPNKNGRKDGIYLPVKDLETSEYSTADTIISDCSVVASKESDVYHNPDSAYVKKIKEDNAVIFNNFKDAEKEGYKPSKFFKECTE